MYIKHGTNTKSVTKILVEQILTFPSIYAIKIKVITGVLREPLIIVISHFI